MNLHLKLFFSCLLFSPLAYAQVQPPVDSLKADSLGPKHIKLQPSRPYDLRKQYDFSDLTRNILHPNKKADSAHKSSGIIVVPNISANPTIGFQGGIKAVAGKK